MVILVGCLFRSLHTTTSVTRPLRLRDPTPPTSAGGKQSLYKRKEVNQNSTPVFIHLTVGNRHRTQTPH